MFTGIVEVVGKVVKLEQLDTSVSGGNGVSLTISGAESILPDCHIGDSISINGTCLTVTEFDSNNFKVGIAPETLRRTNLGLLTTGSKVNLERAMASGFRFGGHFVQGHVDTTAKIVSIEPEGNSLWFRFRVAQPEDEEPLMQYIINKGFIAIDGTSLTVNKVDYESSEFSIMLISHSQDNTIMTTLKVGDKVNIEVDMLGKYVGNIVHNSLNHKESNGLSRLDELVDSAIQKHLKNN
ncbi:Riboflavin synthase [Smittium mucronatum]|uniref:Riboflavin synthase n=1 Tax=Smittium mucronatum TaxID=133383 RepID=A0A1R0H149_9FUNG|nr:Riboflavin synthase [Smittium mucronatum]